jgi:hypothetical protein
MYGNDWIVGQPFANFCNFFLSAFFAKCKYVDFREIQKQKLVFQHYGTVHKCDTCHANLMRYHFCIWSTVFHSIIGWNRKFLLFRNQLEVLCLYFFFLFNWSVQNCKTFKNAVKKNCNSRLLRDITSHTSVWNLRKSNFLFQEPTKFNFLEKRNSTLHDF